MSQVPIRVRARAPAGSYAAGRKYNRLTLIEQRGPYPSGKWLARCDCGTEKEVSANGCWSGQVKSCGCLLRELNEARSATDIYCVGSKFYRMTLVEQRGKRASGAWLVRCECGAEKVVAAHDCRRGRVKSCGCLMLELLKARYPASAQ